MASRFDSAPSGEEIEIASIRWRRWFLDLWANVNAMALPLPTAVTVGASPFIYQYTGAGQASLIIIGAGVTKVEFSRDNTNWFQVSLIAGSYPVSQGDYIRTTFGAAPTMTLVLR